MFWLLTCLWVLLPAESWAWGPGTHLMLGEHALRALAGQGGELARLLLQYPQAYVYGNLIADLVTAKRFRIDYAQHSHNWDVGFSLVDRAGGAEEQAAAWGYLSHLAADIVAHNLFVPVKLALSRDSRLRGHAYWEMRFDAHWDRDTVGRARDFDPQLQRYLDAYFMRHITPTLFSHRTNRQIFGAFLQAQSGQIYRSFAERSRERSRYELPASLFESYMTLNHQAVADLLAQGQRSTLLQGDPTGHANLQLAASMPRPRAARELLRPEIYARFYGILPSVFHAE